MPKGPTKRRPETRSRLLEAAFDLFVAQGYGATSIGEISRRAGYTTGAFYSNFDSKEALFFALFNDHAERSIASIQARIESMDAHTLTIADFIEPFAELGPAERDWFLISSEFTLHAIRNPLAAEVLAAHDARVCELARPALRQVLEAAGVEPPHGVDHLARLIVAIREGGLAQSMVEPDDLAHGELERTYLPLLVAAFPPARRTQVDSRTHD